VSRKEEVLRLLEMQVRAKRENRMKSFIPYPKQYEFFEQGATKRERLLMAGTQVGKSEAGAFETACHLTGAYPDWWPGKRFDHPTRGWAGGEGGLLVRDVSQAKLCGTPGSEEDWGHGMVPKQLLIGKAAGHGVANGLDSIRVKHLSGGVSTLGFKTYDQGRSKWQSATLDFVWPDEEAPEDIYSEALARLTGEGIIYTTSRPTRLHLFGVTLPSGR
jgi:phage terminase large subunit-like protein